jgi:hypothetical protein
MENLFSENRLVYRGGGERPRPREAANESSEVPNGKMLPLAKKMVKDMIDGNNGLSTSKFAKLKSQPDKQKKMIESWLKNTGLSKKEKENLMGTDTITEYYIGNKKVSPDKVATEIHTFIKDKANQKKIMDAIKKEKQQAEQTSQTTETTTQFKEDNSWPSQRAANIASSFYSNTLQKAAQKAMKFTSNVRERSKVTPDKVKNKINSVIQPGAHIAEIRANWGIDSENIKFNGPKAWPMINTSAKRRQLQNKILRSIV